jgi:hypothetical protein
MSTANDHAQWHRHSGTPEVGTAPGTTVRIQRPIPRRGLSRVEAAMYIGISPSKFDELRKDGRIGPAKLLDGRKLFAIEMLDEFFDTLPDENHEKADDWTVAA